MYIKEKTEELKGLLEIGEKYTLLGVSETLATTIKREVYLLDIVERDYAQYKNITQIQYRLRGKRKILGFYLSNSSIILKGWDLGITIDSEYSMFSGNALINIVDDDAESVIRKIEFSHIYGNRGFIVFSTKKNLMNKNALYPEDAEKVCNGHAPLRRMLGKVI